MSVGHFPIKTIQNEKKIITKKKKSKLFSEIFSTGFSGFHQRCSQLNWTAPEYMTARKPCSTRPITMGILVLQCRLGETHTHVELTSLTLLSATKLNFMFFFLLKLVRKYYPATRSFYLE